MHVLHAECQYGFAQSEICMKEVQNFVYKQLSTWGWKAASLLCLCCCYRKDAVSMPIINLPTVEEEGEPLC